MACQPRKTKSAHFVHILFEIMVSITNLVHSILHGDSNDTRPARSASVNKINLITRVLMNTYPCAELGAKHDYSCITATRSLLMALTIDITERDRKPHLIGWSMRITLDVT